MPTWPEFMPAPVYDRISIGAPVGAVLRSQMDAGPVKQRQRFTAAPRPVTLVFEPLSAVNLVAFEAFYEFELRSGALDFGMPHPVTDDARRFRFIASEDPWTVQPIGSDAYRLDANLELLP